MESALESEIKSGIEARDKVCFHCLSPLVPGHIVKAKIQMSQKTTEELFCCNGCKTVAEIIFASGNDHFYKIRGNQELAPVEFVIEGNWYSSNSAKSRAVEAFKVLYDSENTYDEYVVNKNESIQKKTPGAPSLYKEVHINILNIHCSACVWLIEKTLKDIDGINSARINFATGRAHVIWDDSKIKLSGIAAAIATLGYKVQLYAPWKNEFVKEKESRQLLNRMAVAGFFWGNIMLFSAALYAGYFQGIESNFKNLLHYISWILATPVYFYSGFPFLKGTINGLKNRVLTMDFLLILGVSLAYFYSIYVTITNNGEVYFDSVCTIYFFILVGKYFESVSRAKAARQVGSLLSRLPEESVIIENGEEKTILSAKIEKGQTVKLKPGDRIPVDGILISSPCLIDESFLTGEATPIAKTREDKILAGSICISYPITIFSTTAARESTLSRLKNLIEDALSTKPKAERVTDRMASIFVKIVFLVSLVTFFFWFFYSGSLEKAVLNTIAVLIVACPCALGLSVPTALVMNTIINSKKGILIKNPDMVEALAKLDALVFDKTGTLTTGNLQVTGEYYNNVFSGLDIEKKNIDYLAYALEKNSNHPLAIALVKYLEKKYPDFRQIAESQNDDSQIEIIYLEEIPGKGIESKVKQNGKEIQVLIGKLAFQEQSSNECLVASNAKTKGLAFSGDISEDSIAHISLNGKNFGHWTFSDKVRSEAFSELNRLKLLLPEIMILSGDGEGAVRKTASLLNIEKYYADKTPTDKIATILQMQKEGKIIGMVGDGFNDSACIASSHVGISMGVASETSIDKSDVILIHNHLSGIRIAIENARMTLRVIKQNIGLSLFYNLIMIPLAASGLMMPVICAGFMTLSSISVVTNSLSLQWRHSRKKELKN